MYTLKYLKKSNKRIANRELPSVIANFSVGLFRFIIEEQMFLSKLGHPRMKALASTPAFFLRMKLQRRY